MVIYIYTLAHPITGEVRYVGKTDNLARRFSTHTTSLTYKNYTTNWIKSLKSSGLKPVMEVLDETDLHNWVVVEQYWIAQFKAWGFKLTNLTAGGEGSYGRTPPHTKTEDWKQHSSELHKGKTISKETRRLLSNKLKGNTIAKDYADKHRQAVYNKWHENHPSRVYFIQDGILITAVYNSLVDAAKQTKFSFGAIQRACKVGDGIFKEGKIFVHRITCLN